MMLHRYKQSRRRSHNSRSNHYHHHQQYLNRHQYDRLTTSHKHTDTGNQSDGGRHGHQQRESASVPCYNELPVVDCDHRIQSVAGAPTTNPPGTTDHTTTSSGTGTTDWTTTPGMRTTAGTGLSPPGTGTTPPGAGTTPPGTETTDYAPTMTHCLATTSLFPPFVDIAANITATLPLTTYSINDSLMVKSKSKSKSLSSSSSSHEQQPNSTTSSTTTTQTTTAPSSSMLSLSQNKTLVYETPSAAIRSFELLSGEDYLDSYEDYWNSKNNDTDTSIHKSTTTTIAKTMTMMSDGKSSSSSSRSLPQQHKKKKIDDDDCERDCSSTIINSNNNHSTSSSNVVEVIDLTTMDDDDGNDEEKNRDDDGSQVKACLRSCHGHGPDPSPSGRPRPHQVISPSVDDEKKKGSSSFSSSIKICHNLLRGAIFLSNNKSNSNGNLLSTVDEKSRDRMVQRQHNRNETRRPLISSFKDKTSKPVRRVSFGGSTTVAAATTNCPNGSHQPTSTMQVSSTTRKLPPPDSSAQASSPPPPPPAADTKLSSRMLTISTSSSRDRQHNYKHRGDGGGRSHPGYQERTTTNGIDSTRTYSVPAEQQQRHQHHRNTWEATSMVTEAAIKADTPQYQYPYAYNGPSELSHHQYHQRSHQLQQPNLILPYSNNGINSEATAQSTARTARFSNDYYGYNHDRSVLASSSLSRTMISRTMLSQTMSSTTAYSSSPLPLPSPSPYVPSHGQHFYPMSTSHAALAHEPSPHNHGNGHGSYFAREYGVSTNNSSNHYHNDATTSAATAGATGGGGGGGMGRGLLQPQHHGYHHPSLTSTLSKAATVNAFVTTPATISTTTPGSASSRRGSISSNVSALNTDPSVGDCGAGNQDRDRATMSGTSSRTGIKISPIAERLINTKKRKQERNANSSKSEVQGQAQILLERYGVLKSKNPAQLHDQESFPTKLTPNDSHVSRSKKQAQEIQPSLRKDDQRKRISVDNGNHTHKMSSEGPSLSGPAIFKAQDVSVASSSVGLPKPSSAQSTPHRKQHEDRPNIDITVTSRMASTADIPRVESMKKQKPKMTENDKKDNVVVTDTKKKEDKIVVATTKMSSKKVKKKLKNDEHKKIKNHIVTSLSVHSSSFTNHTTTADGGRKKDRTFLVNNRSLQSIPPVSGPLSPPQSSELSSPHLSLLTAAEKNRSKAASLSASATQKDAKTPPIPPSQSQTLATSSSSPNPTLQKKIVQINFVKKINRLAHPTDCLNLNSLHCFVRQELLDVFVLSPGSSDKVEVTRRVGLRCAFCGNLSKSNRKKGIDGVSGCQNMSSFFPKSIEDLYRSVCTWQRVHFPNCPYVPDNINSTYSSLKQQDLSRGKTRHWEDTARLMGLRNASDRDRQGIVYRPTKNMKSKTITMIEPSNRNYL